MALLEKEQQCALGTSMNRDLDGLLRQIALAQPELVMLDAQLHPWNGLAVCQKVSRQSPDLPVLLFQGACSPEAAQTAFQAGARGYLARDGEDPGSLFRSLANLVAGRYFLDPRIHRASIPYLDQARHPRSSAPANLSAPSGRSRPSWASCAPPTPFW
jgi:DNA-binding NarL/FixJ family response regulator